MIKPNLFCKLSRKNRWQWNWRQTWCENFELSDIFRILLPNAYVNRKGLLLVKTVTYMFKLSPTHNVSKICHRHRCNRQNVNPSQIFFQRTQFAFWIRSRIKNWNIFGKRLLHTISINGDSQIWVTNCDAPRVFICLGVLSLFSCITVHLHILDPVSHTYDLYCRSTCSRLNWASWSPMIRKFRMNKC